MKKFQEKISKSPEKICGSYLATLENSDDVPLGRRVYYAGDSGIGSTMITRGKIDPDDKTEEFFLKETTAVHLAITKEEEKTKRLSMTIAAVMFLAALAMVLYAPAEKQNLSYWLGTVLLIAAGGAAGYKRLWAKTVSISMGASGSVEDSNVQ